MNGVPFDVIDKYIATCPFVRWRLSRTCKLFRDQFRDETFLTLMRQVYGEPTVSPNLLFRVILPNSANPTIGENDNWTITSKKGCIINRQYFTITVSKFRIEYQLDYFCDDPGSLYGQRSIDAICKRVCKLWNCYQHEWDCFLPPFIWYIDVDKRGIGISHDKTRDINKGPLF